MNEEEQIVRDKLQSMARYIKAQLPGQDWGFILMCFPFGQGQILYVANSERQDAVQAMREFIAKNTEREHFTKKAFTDQGDNLPADHAFESWWQKEVDRIDGKCPTEWGTVRQLAFDAFIAGMVWSVA
jgi:hypothetical protein